MDALELYLVCRGHGKDRGGLTFQGEKEIIRAAEKLSNAGFVRENSQILTSPTTEEIASAKIIANILLLDEPLVIEWLGKENIMGYLILHGFPKKEGIKKLIVVTEKKTLEKILPNFSYSAFNIVSGSLFKIILPDNKVEKII